MFAGHLTAWDAACMPSFKTRTITLIDF